MTVTRLTPFLSNRFVLVKIRLHGAGYYIYVGVGFLMVTISLGLF